MVPVDWSGEVFNAVVKPGSMAALLMGGEHDGLVGSLVVGVKYYGLLISSQNLYSTPKREIGGNSSSNDLIFHLCTLRGSCLLPDAFSPQLPLQPAPLHQYSRSHLYPIHPQSTS